MNEDKLILLVDDDEEILKLAEIHLKKNNFQVMQAHNVEEAKQLIATNKIKLVISDLKMPGSSGMSLMTWMTHTYGIPVLLMTAFAALLETKQAAALGVKHFISKPFTKDHLISSVKQTIEYDESHPHRPEENFCRIPIKEFLYGSEIPFSIYIKTSPSNFIRVAQKGENLNQNKIGEFQKQNIDHLYLTVEDYKEYCKKTFTFATAIVNDKTKDINTKKKFLVHTAKVVYQKIFTNDINNESFYDVKKLFNLSGNIFTETDTIFDLVRIINSKEDTFYAHPFAVGIYSVLLAQMMGWDTEKTNQFLFIAGFFHDIGKKQIPRKILEKYPRELTIDEKYKLEEHPSIGANLLQKVNRFSNEVIQIIQQHHENCDGTGYPAKTRRNQIFPLARLLSIVDKFCNIVIKSPHNEPTHPILAVSEMEDRYGNELDAEIFKNLKIMVKSGL